MYDEDLRYLVLDAFQQKTNGQPVFVNCPGPEHGGHEDTWTPNLAVYHDHAWCYACKKYYNRDEFAALWPKSRVLAAKVFAGTHDRRKKTNPYLNIPALVETSKNLLAGSSDKKEYLIHRGILTSSIAGYNLGYTGSAYVFPISEYGMLKTVRFRRDDDVDKHGMMPKYWGVPGQNETMMYPNEALTDYTLLLTEGEIDALVGLGRIWGNTRSFTNGCNATPSPDKLKAMLRGIARIGLIRDQDEVGREASRELRRVLLQNSPRYAMIEVFDFRWDPSYGKDLSAVWQNDKDYFLRIKQMVRAWVDYGAVPAELAC